MNKNLVLNLVLIVILFFGLTILTGCVNNTDSNNGLPNEPSPPSAPGSVGTNAQSGDLVGNAGAVYPGYNSGEQILDVNNLNVVAQNPNTDSNNLYADSYLIPKIHVGGPIISSTDTLAIYKTAYYNVEGSSVWIPVPLTGVSLGGNWLKSINNDYKILINNSFLYSHFGYPKSSADTFKDNYLLVFFCKHVGSSWNCFGNHWTINTFNITLTDYCYSQSECYYQNNCSEINSTSPLGKCTKTANGAEWTQISVDACAQYGKCFYNNACYSPGDFVDATNSICNDDLTWATLPDVITPGDNPGSDCTGEASPNPYVKGEVNFSVPMETHIDVADSNDLIKLEVYNSNSANLTILGQTHSIVKGNIYTYPLADIYIKNIIVASGSTLGSIDITVNKFRDVCADSTFLIEYSCNSDGSYKESEIQCADSCSDGACTTIPVGLSLGNYPLPFVNAADGSPNAVFVVGALASSSDNIAMMDIITSMQRIAGTNPIHPLPAGLVKLDSEVTDNQLYNNNVVIVGNSCRNTASARIYGVSTDCNAYDTPGIGHIEVIRNKNMSNVVLFVHGYLDNDTLMASRVLANWERYKDAFASTSSLCIYGNSLNSVTAMACPDDTILPYRTIFPAPLPNIDDAVVISKADSLNVSVAFRNNLGSGITFGQNIDGSFGPLSCNQGLFISAWMNGTKVSPSTVVPNGATFIITWTCLGAAPQVYGGDNVSLSMQFYYTNADTSQKKIHEGTVISKVILDNSLTCVDSDGGLNYYVKGTAYGVEYAGYPADNYVDYCFCDGPNPSCNDLNEMSCSNGFMKQNRYTCPNGCSNGACIQNKTVCPMIASAAPNWCAGGTIISGTTDLNGCQGPPTCKLPVSSSTCLASSGFGCLGAPVITPTSITFSISNGLGYNVNLDSSKVSVYGISCPGNTNVAICAKGNTDCTTSTYSITSAGATVALKGCTLTVADTIKGYVNFKYVDNNGLTKLLTVYLSGKVPGLI